jgi:hypothetical protein
MSDKIEIKILEDGTLSMRTDEISTANHLSADKLLEEMESLMGGKMIFQQDPQAKAHAHLHKHNIQHAHSHK